MIIKHWQGYGHVKAKRISSYNQKPTTNMYGEKVVTLHVRVTGDHEYGLCRNDKYDVCRWIGHRFDKRLNDYSQITDLTVDDSYDLDAHEEVCDYYITFKIKEG